MVLYFLLSYEQSKLTRGFFSNTLEIAGLNYIRIRSTQQGLKMS